MYLALIALPLLGSIVSGFLGRKVGITGAQIITTFSVMLTTIFAAITFFEVGLNNIPVSIQLFKWIDSESLNVYWGFNFDSLTVTMLIPVLIVSSLVHLYSIGYMSHDPFNRTRDTDSRGKLPNSGDLLKLLISSCDGNVTSGWTNYSCKVISQKMNENEMDNRGYKSAFSADFYNNMILFSKSHINSEAILTESLNKLEAVKEQRVDGSDVTDLALNPVALRCTLMDFERNYQVKTLSKQLMSKNFSAFACSKLNPWFISGLIDAEGSFTLVICKNQKRKSGWRTDAKFQIGLYKQDLDLLYLLQQSLEGIGNIHKDRIRNRVIYSIDSIKDLTKLILHIDNYPLLTQKAADCILFKQAIDLLKNKMHLT